MSYNRITDPEVPYATNPGMIPCRHVERRLGLGEYSLIEQADSYGVNVVTDWAGQHVITVQEAARLVNELAAKLDEERELRLAQVEARKRREAFRSRRN